MKAVLVTGASTGIGRKLTERLAARGCLVYAGARKQQDLDALDAIDNVQALRLDVTSDQDIADALDAVMRGGCGLYGLVNNAGIVTLGAVVDGSDAEFELVMAVNVRGPYRVSKVLAPLITSAKGRIVTIGSVTGVLAGANISAYSMSKHAMEAFTDCLASELASQGVHACVIEPGSYNSEIANNAIKRVGPMPLLPDFSQFGEPDDVVAAILHALFDPRPKRRYLVVPNEEEAQYTIKKQIEQLVQLNEGHTQTFDRSALIEMLDEFLSHSQPRSTALSADR